MVADPTGLGLPYCRVKARKVERMHLLASLVNMQHLGSRRKSSQLCLSYMAKKKHVAVYARTSTQTNAQTDPWSMVGKLTVQ